ncbi:MAG: hypothetical protein QOC62_2785 [Mycobacterium sp.]|nr:hypothetical protein [Mycobacterium sp.]
MVIAAELPAVGTEALPTIENKLASLDVHSAWRLLPDVQIGIAHIKSDNKFDEIVALVKSVGDALNGFRDLGDEDREILVDTFRVWQNNVSVDVTAQQLVVHLWRSRYIAGSCSRVVGGDIRGG